MAKPPVLKPREVVALLAKLGFRHTDGRGTTVPQDFLISYGGAGFLVRRSAERARVRIPTRLPVPLAARSMTSNPLATSGDNVDAS